jgi:two-component system sensor histidine kinase KdpD
VTSDLHNFLKPPRLRRSGFGLLITALGIGLMTGLIQLLQGVHSLANTSLLYLLVVIATAVWFGRGVAVVAALLAFLAFNWFFIPPRYTFTVAAAGGWLTLVVFLVTALVVGQLAALLRERSEEAWRREREAAAERDRLARAEMQARALEEADRLKTALLSMVSHDFRSPLASIKASVTGLLQAGAPWDAETQQELLQGIDQETDRLNRMVGNILSLSRLQADAWRPQCELASLAEVVGAALEPFGREEDSRLDVSLPRDRDDVWLDAVQIAQVIHNLVDNALKYSPSGSRVELRGFVEGDKLVLEVLDRGAGIPPGDEERIFEPFYRAPGLRESAVPGVGIGLAVCRGLVEAHGGRLTAANREGGGAALRMSLPLQPASAVDPSDPA